MKPAEIAYISMHPAIAIRTALRRKFDFSFEGTLAELPFTDAMKTVQQDIRQERAERMKNRLLNALTDQRSPIRWSRSDQALLAEGKGPKYPPEHMI